MVDSYQATAGATGGSVTRPGHAPYDKRKLSYANTFTNPWKANTIRALEWMTGVGAGSCGQVRSAPHTDGAALALKTNRYMERLEQLFRE